VDVHDAPEKTQPLLGFATERTSIAPRVQRLAALPAELRSRCVAGAHAVLDPLRLVAMYTDD
jgi:hypothetical protein